MRRRRDLDLLVVGEINPDMVVADDDPVPAFGEVERVVRSIRLTVGSSSVIAACGAARLDLRVAFVGVVGDDPLGRFMLEAMAARGVDVSACTVDPVRPTGATVVLTSGRDRAMLTALGTIGALDVGAVSPAVLDRARHLHLGGYYLQAASAARLPEFFAAARARGLTTSFDANWDPSGAWDGGIGGMLGASDVVFVNEAEARRIARRDDVEDATHELARRARLGRSDGGPIIAVKRGVGGALAVGPDDLVVRVRAMPVDAVDTTGAGDSFDAGFLRAWLDGGSIRECLRFGAACGALSTLGLGGVEAQPTRAAALDALGRWPDA